MGLAGLDHRIVPSCGQLQPVLGVTPVIPQVEEVRGLWLESVLDENKLIVIDEMFILMSIGFAMAIAQYALSRLFPASPNGPGAIMNTSGLASNVLPTKISLASELLIVCSSPFSITKF